MRYRALAFVVSLAVLALGSPAATADRLAEQVKECKKIVLKETPEFRRLPTTAISLSKHNDGVKWIIHWDGDIANGVCVFKKKQFKNLKIKNHLRHQSKHSQNESYRGIYGGFYFDRHIGLWRDPDGLVCNTCTPRNGFPADGG